MADATPKQPAAGTFLHPAITVTNIRSFIPITLEMEKGQYTSWAELFKIHCRAFQVLDHIFPSSSSSTTQNTDSDLWSRIDAIVLQWIYGTISNDLLHTILKPDSTAADAWTALANIFQDNKNSRALYLENKFSNTRLDNFSNISAYCQELKMLSDQLANVGSPVQDQRLVLQLIAGLNDQYDGVAMMIQQTNPLPDFYEARSKLILEETRKASQASTAATAAGAALHAATKPAVAPLPSQPTSTAFSTARSPSPHRGRGRLLIIFHRSSHNHIQSVDIKNINCSMSSSGRLNLEKFLIPLEELNRATQNFRSETQIEEGEYRRVYRGQLSERWQNRNAAIKRRDPERYQGKEVFLNELELMSSFDHENIIPFIGYCDEGDEMIIVTEYPVNGSLEDHLEDPNKRRCLTWAQRLKICLGVATGLKYLHSGFGERGRVIQKELCTGSILLDENMEAKVCDFGLSILIPRNQPYVSDDGLIPGTDAYTDPVYGESGLVNAKTDMYPFGVVVFEMLSGMLAYEAKSFEDGEQLALMQWVRRYYDVGFEKIIDPDIRDQMGRISLNMVKEIAYKCISFNIKDRPTFDVIIKTIDRALGIHNHGAASIVAIPNLQHQNPNSFRIPLEEIKRATQNFSLTLAKPHGRYEKLYTGQLSELWQNRNVAIKRRDPESKQGKEEFLNELELTSSFQHENIIPFIGYCDEADEMIIVTEDAGNGNLYYHLKDPNERRCLTWARRLKISSGVAAGLRYLHSGLGERGKVIKRDANCGNIMLDENMDVKICDFGLSILIPINQSHAYDPGFSGTPDYVDPVYRESGFLKLETDVYSFGVLMFELLSGVPAYAKYWTVKDVKPQILMNVVRRRYDIEPDILVDPLIKNEVDSQSLHAFTDLAYECISFDIRERPTMNRITKRIEALMDFQNRTITTIQSHQEQKLEDFLIPLEEIKRAIGGDFSSKTQAGDGGFGVVYKGELSEHWNKRIVAIKRLKPSDDGGNKDFLNELKLIFRFQDKNIIPFIGYCDEGSEMIIVTEYASNGSLDFYLEDPKKRGGLTWTQRLKICLGAARGLKHLHSGHRKGNRVIHRDIKSANILLDDKMEAKICDFGLSKLDQLTNKSHTGFYTKQAGTMFYKDPIYQESGKLRIKSDVYSFGVVMFEMLSGIMAWEYKKIGDGKPQFLISQVRRYYAAGGLDMLMDPLIRDQPYDARSFQIFQDTAYECINMNYKDRPTMDIIVDRIEEALGYQESLPPAI